MAMLFSLIPSGLWILGLLAAAFGVMFRIFTIRVLFVLIICMIFMPVAWPIACGLIGSFMQIVSVIM